MKSFIFILLLGVSAVFAEEKKVTKRGVFGESLGIDVGSHLGSDGIDSLIDLGSSSDLSSGLEYASGYGVGGLSGIELSGASLGGSHISHGPIDLETSIHKHITVTKKLGIPIPHPYPVPVEKNIPIPVPHPVEVPVDRPYPVHIPKPYPVPVEKAIPVPIEKPVPVPVKIPVRIPISVPYKVAVPQPYPVPIHKPVPVPVATPVIVKRPVPVHVGGWEDESSSGWW